MAAGNSTFKMICFGVFGALFLALPHALQALYNVHVPFLWWIVANGAYYMQTFFHELGHAFFYYYYGHLALPMFMPGGGGLTMGTPQFIPLALGMSGLLFYTVRLNHGNGFWFWLVVFMLVFQLATFFTDFHEDVVLFMGRGTEIVIGGYLLYRALLDLAHSVAERWANALVGFYLLFFNLYESWALAFVPAMRDSHLAACESMGIGAVSDFVRISENLNLPWHLVELFAFGCAVVALVVPFILWERDEDWYEESEERFPV